jgi:hypothetical protein
MVDRARERQVSSLPDDAAQSSVLLSGAKFPRRSRPLVGGTIDDGQGRFARGCCGLAGRGGTFVAFPRRVSVTIISSFASIKTKGR